MGLSPVSNKQSVEALPLIKIAIFVSMALVFIESMVLLLTDRPRRRFFSKMLILGFFVSAGWRDEARASVSLVLVSRNDQHLRFDHVSKEVVDRTSIDFLKEPQLYYEINEAALSNGWIFSRDIAFLLDSGGTMKPALLSWLKRGGFLVVENVGDLRVLNKMMEKLLSPMPHGGWNAIPPDHELMRSFHLLNFLPVCDNQVWRGFQYDGRLAVLAIPYGFLDAIADNGKPAKCAATVNFEQSLRIYINILMVALTTDYKNDQVHLPEILKRLR